MKIVVYGPERRVGALAGDQQSSISIAHRRSYRHAC